MGALSDPVAPSDFLEPALVLYDRGYTPLPSDGKSPAPWVGKWRKWQTKRPSRRTVERWFGPDAKPHDGVGVVTTGSFAVWEADCAMCALRLKHQLRIPPTTRTPHGFHFWGRAPDGAEIGNRVRLGGSLPHVDVRGSNGRGFVKVVGPAPASCTKKGCDKPRHADRRYLNGGPPTLSELPKFPESLLPEVSTKAEPGKSGNGLKAIGSSAYAEAALRNEAAQLAAMEPETGRNDALNKAAHGLARFVVEGTLLRAAIESALYAVSAVNGLVENDGEYAVRNTIRSGLVAGIRDHDGPSDPGRQPLWLPSPAKPLQVAHQLLRNRHRDAGRRLLKTWRGGLHVWEGGRWREIEVAQVRADAYEFTEHAEYLGGKGMAPWAPNSSKISNVFDALRAATHLRESVQPPAWLEAVEAPPARELVAVENGLLHVRTRELIPHNSSLFNFTAVPFPYEPNAPAPKGWLRFLSELWPDDDESITALQEWFGYIISGRTDLQKIFGLIGPPRGGKGTIVHLLIQLVGKDNIASPTLASFGSNFGLQSLIGKTLATVADARSGTTTANMSQVVERMLSISGEDVLDIDRKHRDPWTGALPTRLMVHLTRQVPSHSTHQREAVVAGDLPGGSKRHECICADMARLAARICRRSVRAFGARRSGADRQFGTATASSPRRHAVASPRRLQVCGKVMTLVVVDVRRGERRLDPRRSLRRIRGRGSPLARGHRLRRS